MAKLISKTYGEALFELAVEEEKTDQLLEEITALRQLFLDQPDYMRFLNHPRIPVEEKVQSTTAIFDHRIDEQLVGFLVLIINKGRTENLDEILGYFLDRIKAYKGIGVAYVTTPLELSDEQKEAVCKRLLETTQFKQMEMHYQLDPALLGGMQIRIGDRVVDSSIQTKLNQLQRNLLKIQVS
jgi:F-type H+-transporting ATPase subunit delta